ncbi:hypothetical protein EGW08_002340, partial [Elysia chlorotica]
CTHKGLIFKANLNRIQSRDLDLVKDLNCRFVSPSRPRDLLGLGGKSLLFSSGNSLPEDFSMGSQGLQVGPLPRRKGTGLELGAKSLLRNMIRHTDTHNRLLEEAEMWQMHRRMKEGSASPEDVHRRGKRRGSERFKEPKIENSFLYDDRRDMDCPSRSWYGHKRKAHMDEETVGCSSFKMDGDSGLSQSSSTYWQRQLLKAEENDTDRWGHAGFKELYPQDFDSDRSDHETEKEEGRKIKRVEKYKQKRDKDSKKKKKDKNRDGTKHKKRKKDKFADSNEIDDSRDKSSKKSKKRRVSDASIHKDGDKARRKKQKREVEDDESASKKKRKWECERFHARR